MGTGAVRQVKQLGGASLTLCSVPSGSHGVASADCFIMNGAKRHEVLVQTLGEQRDDIAVLRRGGLAWVCRSSPPLAIEGLDPIAWLAAEQGKIFILGI